MLKRVLTLGILILCLSAMPDMDAGYAAADRQSGDEYKMFLPFIVHTDEASVRLASLPLTFPIMSNNTASYFNDVARTHDIAIFTDSFLQLVPAVDAGRRQVAFASWQQAERELDAVADQIDVIAYNPEHWNRTPMFEQRNLPETVERAAGVAHARGLQFMFVPDRAFAEEHLAEVAPYIDMVTLQGQQLQEDPAEFADWILKMIGIVRANNPQVEIYVQVGATSGPASEMVAALRTVYADIDGISVWSTPRSFGRLREVVGLIR